VGIQNHVVAYREKQQKNEPQNMGIEVAVKQRLNMKHGNTLKAGA
jgi:hypothetical protein